MISFNPYEDQSEMSNAYGSSNPYVKGAGMALADANLFNYGKTKRQLNDKALEWNANMQLWNMQNEYNSPAAQAQRMREAGLNPDLQNLSPGEAGSFSMSPMTTGELPSTMDTILDYGSKIPGVIGNVIGVADKIADVQSKQISNKKEKISFLMQLFSFLAGSAQDYPGADGIDQMVEELKSNKKLRRYTKLFESVRPIAEGSRHASTGYKQETESMQNRLKHAFELFQTWNRDFQRDEAIIGTTSQPFSDLKYGRGGAINEMAKFYGDIIKLELEYQTRKNERGISEEEYRRDSFENADGALAGEAIDAGNDATISEKELLDMDKDYTKKAREKFYSLIDKLSESSEAGDWISTFALMYLNSKGF